MITLNKMVRQPQGPISNGVPFVRNNWLTFNIINDLYRSKRAGAEVLRVIPRFPNATVSATYAANIYIACPNLLIAQERPAH